MANRLVLDRGWLVVYRRPALGAGYGLHFSHAHPGGYAVLRWESSWRTVNGVLINTRWGSAWLLFRRWRCAQWKQARRG
jgi:hypothetical protein